MGRPFSRHSATVLLFGPKPCRVEARSPSRSERVPCRRTSTDISTKTKRLYLATFEAFEEVCAPLEPD